MIPIYPGDIVTTTRHKAPLRVTGRNGCHRDMFIACVVAGGKALRDTVRLFFADEVTSINGDTEIQLQLAAGEGR